MIASWSATWTHDQVLVSGGMAESLQSWGLQNGTPLKVELGFGSRSEGQT